MTKEEKRKLVEDENFMKRLGTVRDKELAEEYGIKPDYVKTLRRSLGIKMKKWPKGIELYAGKTTDKAAAEILGCTITKVFNYRVENRIEPFGCHVASIQKAKEIIAMYEKERTLQKVADHFGITRERVRQILVRSGYKRRFYGTEKKKVYAQGE